MCVKVSECMVLVCACCVSCGVWEVCVSEWDWGMFRVFQS